MKNTVPTSRGFDFYTYANADPYAQPGDEPDADKFNARALRSMQALMKRAKRLQKIVRALSKDVGTKELDVNLSPRGPVGPVGGPGPVGYVSCVLCELYDSRSTGSSPSNFLQLALDTIQQEEVDRIVDELAARDQAPAADTTTTTSAAQDREVRLSKAAEKKSAEMAGLGGKRKFSIGMRLKILRYAKGRS